MKEMRKLKTISIRLNEDIWKKAKKMSIDKDMCLSKFISETIRNLGEK